MYSTRKSIPSSSDVNPFRYCGEYYDTETGLYYLRARYYDPAVGRFTQADTHWNTANMIYGDNPQKINEREDALGLKTYLYAPQILSIMQAGNLYLYCSNDPIFLLDSTGKAAALAQENLFNAALYSAGGFAGVASLAAGIAVGVLVAQHDRDYERRTEASAAIGAIKKENPDAVIIYRLGNGNATNLTPREVDKLGLSYSTVMPISGPFTVTSMEIVNATGLLVAIQDSAYHVSVRPADMSKMQEWIDSRAFALSAPHYFTLLLQTISLKVKK